MSKQYLCSTTEELSWSSSYGSWIYNYLCNQLWVWICSGEVSSIQHYVIKLVSWVGRWFSPCTAASSTNKTDCHDITEILLKVALSTKNLQGFCWLYWELSPNLNWEILSTKYESEMNLGNNKQNNFAVEFISLNYSIMYLSFLFLNLFTNESRSLSDSLSFPSMDILISKSSKFLWVNIYLRRVLIKFIYEKLLSTEAGMIFIK